MPQRGRTDYTDGSTLTGLRDQVAPDGTVLMRTVVLDAVAEAPAPRGSLDATMTPDELWTAVDPRNWYDDVPPSQRGSFHFPEDHTPCTGHAVMRGHAEVLEDVAMPESATVPVVVPDAPLFRADAADAAGDNSMRAFHLRTSKWLASGTVSAPRGDVGLPLDTRILATVSQSVFTSPTGSEAAR